MACRHEYAVLEGNFDNALLRRKIDDLVGPTRWTEVARGLEVSLAEQMAKLLNKFEEEQYNLETHKEYLARKDNGEEETTRD